MDTRWKILLRPCLGCNEYEDFLLKLKCRYFTIGDTIKRLWNPDAARCLSYYTIMKASYIWFFSGPSASIEVGKVFVFFYFIFLFNHNIYISLFSSHSYHFHPSSLFFASHLCHFIYSFLFPFQLYHFLDLTPLQEYGKSFYHKIKIESLRLSPVRSSVTSVNGFFRLHIFIYSTSSTENFS